jgi:hypothetical protein
MIWGTMNKINWIVILLVLLSSRLFADTYLYRVGLANVKKEDIRQFAEVFTVKDDAQPFIKNQVLLTKDTTNYVLLKMTLPTGEDPALEMILKDCELYQVQRIDEEGFIRNVVDNSKEFPVDRDWSVDVSSSKR